MTGLDSEVQFSRVPRRFARPSSAAESAPAAFDFEQNNVALKGRQQVDSTDSEYERSYEQNINVPRQITHSTPRPVNFEPQKQVLLKDRKGGQFLNGNEFPVHHGDRRANNDNFEPKGQLENKYIDQNQYRRQKEPDKFEEGNMDWSDYLHYFKTVANWNRWTYDEMGMQSAMCLKGDAQRIVTDSHEVNGCIDYNTLVGELNYRYNPAQREYTYKIEFRGRLKRNNETAMQYGYALRRLVSKAFPNVDRECQEQLVLDQFVMGLVNMDIKRHVQFGHPNDLNQAISLAAEFESFDQNSLHKTFKPTNSMYDQNASVNAVCDEHVNTDLLNKLFAKLDKSMSEIEKLNKEVKKSENGTSRFYK